MNRLVTIALFAYNSEKYIVEAIEGVLSQDYTPLEVIISDDASTDATFSIIQQYAVHYVGPHKIIARKNEINQGLCQHINTVWSLVGGEWLVVAAGDDISVSDRVSQIMRHVEANPEIQLIASFAKIIDEAGNELGIDRMADNSYSIATTDAYVWDLNERINNGAPLPHGATLAYSRVLIDKFPPLPSNSIFEDNIIGFRGELLGKCSMIRLPLISYRNHSEQITKYESSDIIKNDIKRRKLNRDGVITVGQNLVDLEYSELEKSDAEKYAKVTDWLNLKLLYFSRFRQALDLWWPIRLIPFILLYFSKPHFTPISRDLKARIALPTALYFLLKKAQLGSSGGRRVG